MKVKPEQLIKQLKTAILPVIWISGDESLLLQEACDDVRKFAKEQGFLEREIMNVGPNFEWSQLLDSSNSLSLFAEKKIIDLRLPSAKLDNDAKKSLQAYVDNPSEDNLLLISSPKIEKSSISAKWFKAIEQHAHFVQIWPVTANQLPSWIDQRLKKHGLTAEPQAIQVLVHRVEGNLLAAVQEIEKLSILTEETHLTPQTVARAVADNARYNVFSLLDATLEGNSARALNILYHLKAEGSQPLQILNLLCGELRNLIRMTKKIEQGHNMHGVMQSERVWSNRTNIVGAALQRHTPQSLEAVILNAQKVDQSIKGLQKANPWDELIDIILKLSSAKAA